MVSESYLLFFLRSSQQHFADNLVNGAHHSQVPDNLFSQPTDYLARTNSLTESMHCEHGRGLLITTPSFIDTCLATLLEHQPL